MEPITLTVSEQRALRKYEELSNAAEAAQRALAQFPQPKRTSDNPEWERAFDEYMRKSKALGRFTLRDKNYIQASRKRRDMAARQYVADAARKHNPIPGDFPPAYEMGYEAAVYDDWMVSGRQDMIDQLGEILEQYLVAPDDATQLVMDWRDRWMETDHWDINYGLRLKIDDSLTPESWFDSVEAWWDGFEQGLLDHGGINVYGVAQKLIGR